MLLMLRVCIVKELGEVDDNSDTDEKDEECMMDDDVRWLNTNTQTHELLIPSTSAHTHATYTSTQTINIY